MEAPGNFLRREAAVDMEIRAEGGGCEATRSAGMARGGTHPVGMQGLRGGLTDTVTGAAVEESPTREVVNPGPQ